MKSFILFLAVALTTGSSLAVTQFETKTSPINYCQSHSTANTWAHGYGSDYANCSVARRNAESAAIHYCYAAGHSQCELAYSRITYTSYNRCDAEALARSAYQSQCRPERTFTHTAWAQHYGSEVENCRVARRIASNYAVDNCQRAGYRRCQIVNTHNLRINGNQFCESAAIAKGSF